MSSIRPSSLSVFSKSYFKSNIFLVCIKSLAWMVYRYIPAETGLLKKFVPFHTTDLYPDFWNVSTNDFILRPIISYTTNFIILG